uniref:Uncharacterized protein n=1 Tax=Parascaris univalens TaxID=6257 RepID=A0A914ZET4_PARUN
MGKTTTSLARDLSRRKSTTYVAAYLLVVKKPSWAKVNSRPFDIICSAHYQPLIRNLSLWNIIFSQSISSQSTELLVPYCPNSKTRPLRKNRFKKLQVFSHEYRPGHLASSASGK